MSLSKKILLLIFLIIPTLVFAADGETPIGAGLQYFINAMNGPTGVAIATLAIIAVGIACLSRFFDWIYFIYTVIGISIIFGASTIVSGIQGLVGHQ